MSINTSTLLRSIYALCLLIAASTHVWTIATHGLFYDYGGVPLFTRIFWTSLTVLDPLAAVILFVKPRVGIILTFIIIVADVLHNTWLMNRATTANWSNWMYVLQVVFLIFVLLTNSRAWNAEVSKKST